MDFVERFANMGNPFARASPQSLLKFTDLAPAVQKHLSKVYVTLAGCMALVAAGCYIGMLASFLLPLAGLASFGCMLGLAWTPDTPYNLNKRYMWLAGFSLAQGCALTPLVSYASALMPGLVMTAVMCTAAIFLCFSASALLTPRRAYLFLGGYLSSAVAALFVLRLASWAFGNSGLGFNLELYGGLMVFSGYILFDTQLIVEKASAGYMDHVRHAQDLLVDLLAIFVRVLVVLIRNAQKREQEEQQRNRRKGRRD